TAKERIPAASDVPTMAEQGVADFVSGTWAGLIAPAGTPKEIVDRFAREIAKALANPKVIDQMEKTGVEPLAMTPDEFGRYIKREYDTWGKVVKEAGIKAQ
ncbi:MAG: hypothetical protein QOD26_1606, partial [Betaproteobacteria bacterium]|nr:hypothetical protein [Betaproteobacteria bacterium]